MADKGTYEVVVAMEEYGKYDTFKEAFKIDLTNFKINLTFS